MNSKPHPIAAYNAFVAIDFNPERIAPIAITTHRELVSSTRVLVTPTPM